MSYWDRLRSAHIDRPLFTHPVFTRDNLQVEMTYRKAFEPLVNNPANLPEDERDEAILRFIGRFPRGLKPDVLKVFGSTSLRLDYVDPILITEVQRGNLSDKKAARLRKAIAAGELNPFFNDIKVGFVTNWGVENAAAAIMLINPGEIIPDDSKILVVGLFKAVNIFALPHFLVRAKEEIKYVTQKEQGPISKALDRLFIAGSVVSNLIPIASNFATPFMNLPRHGEFSRMLIRHEIGNWRKRYKNIVI